MTNTETKPVYSAAEFVSLEMGEYRTRFPDETKHLSDEQVFNLVTSLEDDLDDSAWRSLFAGHKPNEPASAELDSEAQKARALSIGAKEDDATAQAIVAIMNAREENAVGAINVMNAFLANYGEEEMLTWPRVDSEAGNNPDKFSIRVTKSDGKETNKKVSFYNLGADNSKTGRAIIQELDWLAAAGNDNANKSGIPEHILDMNSIERARRMDYLDGRKTANRTAHKDAAKLFWKFHDVRALAEIDCSPIWADEEGGEIERTKKPIMVWRIPGNMPNGTPMPIANFRHFSVGQFLKLDTAKAIENGATFKALMATVDRQNGGAGSGGKADDKTLTIKTTTTGVKTLVEFHRWMVEIMGDKTRAQLAELYKTAKHKDADELCTTIVETRNMLNQVIADCNLGGRYSKLVMAQSDLVSEEGKATANAG